MIADAVRMNAYRDALARSIAPGDVVLDLGAGTGIMSLLACRLGAARVYAVEPSDAIVVGMELARANGCEECIEFIQKSSLDARLRRRARVMVSDLRGVLPLHGLHLLSVADARRRLLMPGGIQIPRRDTLRAQLVADAALYAKDREPWRGGACGLDLSPALKWQSHCWRKADLSRSRLVGEARPVIELDYRTLESANAVGRAQWTLDCEETVHGLGAWFDAELADGIGFSNAPSAPPAIYGQAFFPFPAPLEVRAGQQVGVMLAATLVNGSYVWQWTTTLRDGGRVLKEWRQSSFQATPVNPARLARRRKRR
jgi:protein arginine N-methyltransferase 1